ncbi:MAG: hypothetical protein ACRC8Q_06020 [Aeromonas sp.]
MNISDFVSAIPETSASEALNAIASIKLFPAEKKAALNCHLSAKFIVTLQLMSSDVVVISAPGAVTACATIGELAAELGKVIYAADEAISEGLAVSNAADSMSAYVFPTPPAPDHMDIPVWDADKEEWYDAEI